MIWRPIKATFFALAIAFAKQAHAQEFEVAAWLERCTSEASQVQELETADGKAMQFSVLSCLTTARRTCQFADDALSYFSQYEDAVERLIRKVRADLPEQVDGDGWQSKRLNRMLSDDNNSIENYEEFCLNSVESDFPVELLNLPVEIRTPVKACKILAPSFELGLLLGMKDLFDSIQSKD